MGAGCFVPMGSKVGHSPGAAIAGTATAAASASTRRPLCGPSHANSARSRSVRRGRRRLGRTVRGKGAPRRRWAYAREILSASAPAAGVPSRNRPQGTVKAHACPVVNLPTQPARPMGGATSWVVRVAPGRRGKEVRYLRCPRNCDRGATGQQPLCLAHGKAAGSDDPGARRPARDGRSSRRAGCTEGKRGRLIVAGRPS
jgi:hypothetical protein